MPTIAGIQRVTATLILFGCIVLFAFVSRAVSIGFLVGGLLMIGNLYLLEVVGKVLVGLAQGGSAGKTSAALVPLKLMLFVVVAYLLISRLHVDLPGFGLGILTQFAAIFIETGRVSLGRARKPQEQNG